MPRFGKRIALWAIIGLLLLALFNIEMAGRNTANLTPYSDFVDQTNRGQVVAVRISGRIIAYTLADGQSFTTHAMDDPALTDRLIAKNVKSFLSEPTDADMPPFFRFLANWWPMLLLIAVWLYGVRRIIAHYCRAKKPEQAS